MVRWRGPGVFAAGLLVAALLIGGAYLGLAQRPSAPQTKTPTVPSYATPQAYATPVANLKAVTGVAPTVVSATDGWQQYSNPVLSLTLRYPPGWKFVEDPQQSGVRFYPPDSDPNLPSPLISFSLAANSPYNAQSTPSPYTTQAQPIAVAGVTGRQYEDTAYAVPTQGFYIDLPYRNGTLFISATKGPNVNLVPQLQEMLKALVLRP